jgi:glycosyltransferase involved in cell wall biosynthesis
MAGRPRVALVGWRLGGEFEEAIRQGHERFDYVVITMTLDPALRPLVEWQRIPLLRWNSFRLRWLIFYVLAGLRLARARADLVHTVGPTPVVPNRVDLNTVTFCHAAYDEATAADPVAGTSVGWQVGQRMALALERWWFRNRVRTLAGISPDGAEDLRRHYRGTDVVELPRGLYLRRFGADREAREELRRELSVGPDEVVALFVDQDHRPLKGLDLAIEAFAGARRENRGPDQLWVLGLGNESQAALAHRLGVAGRVRFLGYRGDMERIYPAADMFVLPTVYETLCRAAHEAAACELPIVAPPVSGIRSLVGADEGGIVAARDPRAIQRALIALALDPDRRSRLGRVARSRAMAFDVTRAGARMTQVHEAVIASR